MKCLDIRDISIIDALPTYNSKKVVLNVGCGKGRIDFHLSNLGYRVYATDIKNEIEWDDTQNRSFHVSNIFNLESFPIKKAEIVICSQVIEHLPKYKLAVKNLLELTERRLIITVPFKKSFGGRLPPPVGHCNFWDWDQHDDFEMILEFQDLCFPFSVSTSKIRTKPRDIKKDSGNFLIIVDKQQPLQ